MEQQIANLPPWAMVVFGSVLAIIFGVRYFGLWQGRQASPSATTNTAQVAAVIMDPATLDRATDSVRSHTDAKKRLTDAVIEISRHVDTLGKEVDRIREELRIQREILRDR
jgi:hypothetical protein